MKISSYRKIERQVEAYIRPGKIEDFDFNYEGVLSKLRTEEKKYEYIRTWCSNQKRSFCCCKEHPDYNDFLQVVSPLKLAVETIYNSYSKNLKQKRAEYEIFLLRARNAKVKYSQQKTNA